MNYWLMKSEPGNYSIDHLSKDKSTAWTGVRNYQARNFMIKDMKRGDLALFYHSNATPSGVAGIMRIKAEAHADMTAFDPQTKYYDPKATAANPIWKCVDVAFVEKFDRIVPLSEIRGNRRLAKMEVLRQGSRLSIQPATEAEFLEICRMAKED